MKGVRNEEDGARRPGNGLERDAPATFVVDRWRGREEFKERVHEWTRKLEVEAHSIYIQPMQQMGVMLDGGYSDFQ